MENAKNPRNFIRVLAFILVSQNELLPDCIQPTIATTVVKYQCTYKFEFIYQHLLLANIQQYNVRCAIRTS